MRRSRRPRHSSERSLHLLVAAADSGDGILQPPAVTSDRGRLSRRTISLDKRRGGASHAPGKPVAPLRWRLAERPQLAPAVRRLLKAELPVAWGIASGPTPLPARPRGRDVSIRRLGLAIVAARTNRGHTGRRVAFSGEPRSPAACTRPVSWRGRKAAVAGLPGIDFRTTGESGRCRGRDAAWPEFDGCRLSFSFLRWGRWMVIRAWFGSRLTANRRSRIRVVLRALRTRLSCDEGEKVANHKTPILGLCPIGKFVFSHEDACDSRD